MPPDLDALPSLNISGMEKAGILCLSMGDDFAHRIMDALDEKEQELLTLAIAKANAVGRDTSEPVVREFNALMQGAEWLAEGGIEYARALLEGSVGKAKAEEILQRIRRDLDETGLNRLRKADPEQLRTILRGELPQTIALIMAHFDPRQCSAVLEGFEMDLAADVLYRIATMEKVSPEMLEIIENALGVHALNLSTQMSSAGGPGHVAEVLNNTGGSVEKELLERIQERDAEMSTEIKNLLFVFEDLVRLSDKAMQTVLREVDSKELAVALKVATPELIEAIYANMSNRAREALEDEQEFLGAVKVRSVDAAQSRIISIVRRLEEEEKIQVSSGAEGDELVE